MTTPSKWEIWLASVKFEEKPGLKDHPVLVVSPGVDCIISLFITSHSPKARLAGEYPIQNWEKAGLWRKSTIWISNALEMKPDDFIHKIGDLHQADIIRVQEIWKSRSPRPVCSPGSSS